MCAQFKYCGGDCPHLPPRLSAPVQDVCIAGQLGEHQLEAVEVNWNNARGDYVKILKESDQHEAGEEDEGSNSDEPLYTGN